MGNVTSYSLDGVMGGPEYLLLLYAEAQAQLRAKAGSNPSQELLLSEALTGIAVALDVPKDKVDADRDKVRKARSKILENGTRAFAVHSSFDHVPRRLLEHITERELGERTTTRFSKLVARLTESPSSVNHCGGVLVQGAHPHLHVTRWEDLPPKGDPAYKVNPFETALRAHRDANAFFVPYQLYLDMSGFLRWVEHSRTQFGAHTTLVGQIERECLY